MDREMIRFSCWRFCSMMWANFWSAGEVIYLDDRQLH